MTAPRPPASAGEGRDALEYRTTYQFPHQGPSVSHSSETISEMTAPRPRASAGEGRDALAPGEINALNPGVLIVAAGQSPIFPIASIPTGAPPAFWGRRELSLIGSQWIQSNSYTTTNFVPIPFGQTADNRLMCSSGQSREKTAKDRRNPQTRMRPILQYIVRRTKFRGLTCNQADDHIRSRSMINRRGDDDRWSAFDLLRTRKFKHHHVARNKQGSSFPGRVSMRSVGKPTSNLPGLARSRHHSGPQLCQWTLFALVSSFSYPTSGSPQIP